MQDKAKKLLDNKRMVQNDSCRQGETETSMDGMSQMHETLSTQYG